MLTIMAKDKEFLKQQQLMDYSMLIVFFKRGFGQRSSVADSESYDPLQLSGEHERAVGRFSEPDMMPGNNQLTVHMRQEDQLFAIVENDEELKEDEDLIMTPPRPIQTGLRRALSRNGSPTFREFSQNRKETPSNDENKFSVTEGANPFRIKPTRGQSEVELRHMSTV